MCRREKLVHDAYIVAAVVGKKSRLGQTKSVYSLMCMVELWKQSSAENSVKYFYFKNSENLLEGFGVVLKTFWV